MLWLNEKHMEGLDHENLQEITIKYHSHRRKHRYELVEEPKKQCNRIFIGEEIMDCSTTSVRIFRTRLGFEQYATEVLTRK